MIKQYKTYLLCAILFIVGLTIGYFTGKNSTPPPIIEEIKEESSDGLYSLQSASIRGKITSINDNILTVINSNTGVTGEVVASKRVTITKPGSNKPSTDITTIETDKEILIGLEMVDGEYQAISIQYITPPPSITPRASN